MEEQANLKLLIVGCIPQSLPTNFICIVHGQFKTINLNILRTKKLFSCAQNYTKHSPNILNFSMFGLNLEANLYLESVSKCLSGYFPVLNRESLLITYFMQLKKKKRKQSFFSIMQSFFNKENRNKVQQKPYRTNSSFKSIQLQTICTFANPNISELEKKSVWHFLCGRSQGPLKCRRVVLTF